MTAKRLERVGWILLSSLLHIYEELFTD